MLKALADRLAEAFAEWLHGKVRRELWGYARDEALDNAALIREEYRGIRPAPGYPACPDHAVKAPLFALLARRAIGMTLTENFAMLPAAAVSGFYLAHPDARYFAVGRIGDDQLADFAARTGIGVDEAPQAARAEPVVAVDRDGDRFVYGLVRAKPFGKSSVVVVSSFSGPSHTHSTGAARANSSSTCRHAPHGVAGVAVGV